jgi:TonB family protein
MTRKANYPRNLMGLTPVPTMRSMGYQALLFCPDEKTARTVTQVLSELEFSVAACGEPFAAVKKLMSDHFDALVVDCDNEQNATLLFKSARNSASNQTSLAVAVVEGQAGVAKAFRFGANLVLTKPINVEQAKGTLRVARGLLRKGEPGKPAAPGTPVQASASVPAAPAKPAATNPAPKPAASAAPRPAVPVAVKPGPSSLPPKPVPATASPVAKRTTASNIPAPAQPVLNHPAASGPSSEDADLLEIGAEDSASAPAASSAAPAAATKDNQATPPKKLTTWVPAASAATAETKTNLKATPAASFGSAAGSAAASAPAPALEPAPAAEETPATNAENTLDKPAEAAASESHSFAGPTTTFTFGGAAVQEESGGSKKILLVVAAVVLVAAGGYFGWNYYQSRASQNAAPVASRPAQTAATQAAATQPAAVPPATAQSAPAPTPNSVAVTQSPTDTPAATPNAGDADEENDAPAVTPAPKKPANSSPSASKPAATKSAPGKAASDKSASDKAADDKANSDDQAPAPLVVKGGQVSSLTKKSATAASSDAPAPSVIGMAVPAAGAPPLNLAGGNATAPKPLLEKLNVSQGVSQGLLIKKVSPVYPHSALTMHVEGAVELLATISKTGDISSVKVLSGDAQLSKAATDAVKQWKYKPYLLNGEPVEIQTQVTINFRLPN